MRYEGRIFRPPSEAGSYILQVTIGCSHNKCSFCSMYKEKNFKIKNIDDIKEDIKVARENYKDIRRVFLADGNSLVLNTNMLKNILLELNNNFENLERVGIYASAKDILSKKDDELKELNDLGLKIIYLGAESGDDNVLSNIKKNATSEDLITAGKKIMNSKIKLSMTFISGIGGKERFKEHSINSAKVINAVKPDYLALLTLLIDESTPLAEDIKNGKFKLLNPIEVLEETKLLIENLDLNNTIFRSNHASNYISLAGNLNKDKNRLIIEIDETMKEFKSDESILKNEYYRSL